MNASSVPSESPPQLQAPAESNLPTNQSPKAASSATSYIIEQNWEERLAKLDSIVISLESRVEGRYGAEVPWSRWCRIAALVFLVIATLAAILRPDFFTVCLAIGGVTLEVFVRDSTDWIRPIHIKLYAVAVLASIGLDIAWLLFYAAMWSGSNFADGAENSVRTTCLLISVLNMPIKAVVAFLMLRTTVKRVEAA